MDLTAAEQQVLERFAYRSHVAGGAKAGQSMRRRAIEYLADDAQRGTFGEGLDGLVGKGVLKLNEAGDRYFLTEAGAELLAG